MRFRINRVALPLIGAVALLAVPAGSAISATVNLPSSVTVDLPGVPATQALEVCTQDDGQPASCKKITTPNIQRGQLTVGWNTKAGATVAVTPTSPFPLQCGGRAGAALRAYVGGVSTDITMAVKVYYAGQSIPTTEAKSKRSVDPDKGTTIWACVL